MKRRHEIDPASIPEASIARALDTPEGRERQLRIASNAEFRAEMRTPLAMAQQRTKPDVLVFSANDGGRTSIIQRPGDSLILDLSVTSADGSRTANTQVISSGSSLVEVDNVKTRLFRPFPATIDALNANLGTNKLTTSATYIAFGEVVGLNDPYVRPLPRPSARKVVKVMLTREQIPKPTPPAPLVDRPIQYNLLHVGQEKDERVVTVFTGTAEGGVEPVQHTNLFACINPGDLAAVIGDSTEKPRTRLRRVQVARNIIGLPTPLVVTVLQDGSYGR